jgi:hypothetical protein
MNFVVPLFSFSPCPPFVRTILSDLHHRFLQTNDDFPLQSFASVQVVLLIRVKFS